MDSGARVVGKLVITMVDEATGHECVIHTHNRVVNNGLAYIINLMAGDINVRVTTMAIGSNPTAVTPNDGWLFNEMASASVGQTQTSLSIMYSATFPAGAGVGDVAELGLFLPPAGGGRPIFARSVIPAQTKSATTTMKVDWTISLLAS